jgi:UDP-N-acetylglucosamine 2-epimerase (non-hydrolysing)
MVEKLRVLSVIGTRPEAIKMAPVIEELGLHPSQIESIVCSTGQHRELLDQVLGLFNIGVDHELNVMRPGQSLSRLTASLFSGLDEVIGAARPNWVLAQGDTTTVLVAALVSYYHRCRFGHVEAGLRTGDRFRPFPEEVNRTVADVVADLLFAPTLGSRQALVREGYPDRRIVVTGNTVVDALRLVASLPYDWSAGPLARLPRDERMVLITAHRRESFGEPFQEICLALRELAQGFEAERVHFVFPVHLNPNVQRPVREVLSGLPNLSLLPPLDYQSLVQLMKRATLILTDSGGIQEEAPALNVPVLVLRDRTERPEGVEAGVVRLVGTSRSRIVEEAGRLLRDPAALAAMVKGVSPYGDGHAAARIVSAILRGVS